jgi:hypothetical protein
MATNLDGLFTQIGRRAVGAGATGAALSAHSFRTDEVYTVRGEFDRELLSQNRQARVAHVTKEPVCFSSAQELGDRGDDGLLLVFAQFGEDWQRQDLAGSAFGLGEAALGVAEVL